MAKFATTNSPICASRRREERKGRGEGQGCQFGPLESLAQKYLTQKFVMEKCKEKARSWNQTFVACPFFFPFLRSGNPGMEGE